MKLIINLSLLVLGVIIGISGTLVYKNQNTSKDEMTHEAPEVKHGGDQDHKGIEVNPDLPIPSVKLNAYEDVMGGYNVKLDLTNYTITPEKVNSTNVPNEGHLHLYVNEVGIARVYGEWHNIKKDLFKPGENKIKVTLNANDHSDWLLNDEHIESEVAVIVAEK